MNWFSNLKISKKLILSFMLVALICGAMGVYAIYDLKLADKSETELYQNITVPITQMDEISVEFQRMRASVRDLIIAQSADDINTNINKINQNMTNIDKLSESFKETGISSDIEKQFEVFIEAKKTFKPQLDRIIEVAKENKDAEAVELLSSSSSEVMKASKAEQESIEKLVSMKIADAKAKADLNTEISNRTITIMVFVIIFVMVIAVIIGLYISGLITKPIKRVLIMIEEMSKGHLRERLNITTNDEVGQMAKIMDKFADDLQISVIEVMNKISEGDVSIDIALKDEKDEISPALKKTVETINRLNKGINNLIKETTEGKLDVRGHEDLYSGAWKDIVTGINGLIDTFVAPINMTAEYINKIGSGNIPDKITDTYYGDFNEIKNSLNNCIDNITALVTDANMLSRAATEGKLDTRADATKHSGDFKKIVEGVNELIEAMVKPIKEVTSVLSEMSKGNLEVSVNGDYKGEFGVLAKAVNTTEDGLKGVVEEISEIIGEISNGNLAIENVKEFDGNFKSISVSLNTIIDSLNSVLSEINTASEQVYTGSSQVSDGSQALSQGATEQASAIEQLTSSINEVAEQTKENAVNANQAKNLALNVKENAEDGNRHMSEMLKSMGDINESSANISKIIKVIDEIAFQTNILALNAAVEAARAGQHGKGFAVVAEEVRNLAARSANAAKETTDLIEGSIKKAEKGTEIANNTAKALYEIVDGVSKAATLVAEIAASSNEQATGISQINLGIEQVSQVVQTNSATAEESAAASEELSSQAELLKDLVSSFKLKNSNSSSSLNNRTKNKQYYSKENNITFKEVAATFSKPKIALSDKEFGKY